MKKFSTTGKAPIVKRSGFVQYPFGEVQPILNCQPNYGCDIQLQAGETVKAVILGNEPMWDYLVWESNQQFDPISHVTIGPRVSSARTNAIIGTDRRTYHLELLSSSKAEYVRSAKFYYPRERLRQYQAKQLSETSKKKRNARISKQKALLEEMSSSARLPHQFISFGWEIEADPGASWKPTRVFDDGLHVYLQFPEHVSFEDLPGIYIPTDDGKLSQPAWRTVKPDRKRSREKGAYLMVDGIFDELQLIGGFSGEQKKVVIRKAQ
jgi:type IV secretion system protein VirB9